MTYNDAKIRSAMTAVAAVLALSSTPLFAQDAGVPDPVPETSSEPVNETPDPLAPEPAAEAPPATDTADEPATVSKPVAKAKVAAPRSSATARPSVARSPAATAAAPAANVSPAVAEPADPLAAAAEAAPVVPPAVPAETADVGQAQEMDNMLEMAGAAGAGLLALVGAGVALRSRRRRKQEERIEEVKWAYIEAHPDVENQVTPEPAFVRTPTPKHDPVPSGSAVPAGAATTKLPSGFDLSRFGPHVQAAYRGPTPDNPSLSLRYRLRRASALDQQERRARKEAATHPAVQAPAQPAQHQPSWAMRDEAKFMLRRAGANNGAKPAFQR